MKQAKRIVSVLLVSLMLFQGVAFADAAPVSSEWLGNQLVDGVYTVAVMLHDRLEDGEPVLTPDKAQEYEVELVVSSYTYTYNEAENTNYIDNVEELYRAPMMGPTTAVSFAQPGNYQLEFVCYGGLPAWKYGTEEDWNPYFIDESVWSNSTSGEDDELPEEVAIVKAQLEELLRDLGLEDLTRGDLMEAVLADEACHSLLLDFTADICNRGDEDILWYIGELEDSKYMELVCALMAEVQFGGESEPIFSDVPADAWYADYVEMAAGLGLVNGKGDGLFAPNDNLSIAEALTLAARYDATGTGREIAPAQGAWYQCYVDYMRDRGLPWEYADYGAIIDRAEFAHIMNAAVCSSADGRDSFPDINTVPDGSIPDVPAAHRYAADIYNLYRIGVLTGSDPVTHIFKPTTEISRCEVATILCRMVGINLQSFTMP